jgi:hypothetical protein
LDAALALVARRPSWMMAKRRRWRIIEPTACSAMLTAS